MINGIKKYTSNYNYLDVEVCTYSMYFTNFSFLAAAGIAMTISSYTIHIVYKIYNIQPSRVILRLQVGENI